MNNVQQEVLHAEDLEIQDNLGFVVRWTMYHLKSIEHRFRWSRAQNQMKATDKTKCSSMVRKIELAIMEYSLMFKQQATLELVHSQIRSDARMVEVMFLTEALYDLNTKDLGEVTTIIENYIKQKHDSKRHSDTAGNEQGKHHTRTLPEEAPQPVLC